MKFDPREDGLTHINIYSKGISPLGRSLSNFERCPINISIGKFESIEGLIFYLGSFDEKLRSLYGYEAKQYGEAKDRNIRLPRDVFKRIVVEAMEAKSKNYKAELRKSTLPFTHYYAYGTKVVELPKWEWQVIEWERIRAKVKSGRI